MPKCKSEDFKKTSTSEANFIFSINIFTSHFFFTPIIAVEMLFA
jgi:hypothetical protein